MCSRTALAPFLFFFLGRNRTCVLYCSCWMMLAFACFFHQDATGRSDIPEADCFDEGWLVDCSSRSS